MSRFTNKLEWLMIQKHTNWNKVSADLGLSNSSLNYWKANDTFPKASVISLLCDYFSVSADELLGIVNPPEYMSEKSNVEFVDDNDTRTSLDNIYLDMFKLLPIKDKLEIISLIMTKLEDNKQ